MDYSVESAFQQDSQDPLKHLRAEFIIPTKADLKSKVLATSSNLFLASTARLLEMLISSFEQ